MKEKRKTLTDITNTKINQKYPDEIEKGHVVQESEILGMILSDESCETFMYDDIVEYQL